MDSGFKGSALPAYFVTPGEASDLHSYSLASNADSSSLALLGMTNEEGL